MSKHDDGPRPTNLPATYEVGYGKPPVATRFRKGQSGNPNGRRKGAKAKAPLPALNDERLKTIILEEAYRSITINDPNGTIDIPMAQAVVRSLAVNAAKGNQQAQRVFTQLLSNVERDNKRLHDQWLDTAINYKVEWERELERRKTFGINGPAPLPHPDDIIIDMNTGSVRIKGPMTKEEKVKWDKVRYHSQEARTYVEELKSLLIDEPDHPERQIMEDEIRHSEKVLAMINKALE